MQPWFCIVCLLTHVYGISDHYHAQEFKKSYVEVHVGQQSNLRQCLTTKII